MEKFGGGTPPYDQGPSGPKALAFEGTELYRQTTEQLDLLKRQVDEAEAATIADIKAIGLENLRGMALEKGVRDREYKARWGTIPDYAGEAEIEINGRKYKAVGRGPQLNIDNSVVVDSFIEYIPQEIPPAMKDIGLFPEQKALCKMSDRQLSFLQARIDWAEAALTQEFDQIHPFYLQKLALEHGIRDVSFGWGGIDWGARIFRSYEGEVEVIIHGKRYKAIGHADSKIDIHSRRDGYIEWHPVEGAEK